MFERPLIAGLALLLCGCAGKPNPPAPASLQKKVTSAGAVVADDPELNAAIAKGRQTLDTFIDRLRHPQRGEVFSVEAIFPALDGSPEYLWVGDVSYKDGVFSGTLNSKPPKAASVKYQEPASAKKADVTDWMIIRSGKSEGAFTVDVLLRRESQPH